MYIALIQNESYSQSPEKTKYDGEHENRDNIDTWNSWFHSLMSQAVDCRLPSKYLPIH